MRFIFVLSVLLVLSGCAPVKQSDNVAPTVEKGGFMGLSKTNDIEVNGANAVKGENRAVVPYFRVAYYTENNPGGFTGNGGDKIVIRSELMGVESDTLQRITDEAYKNFVDQMKQKGIEVLPLSSLKKSPTYQTFKGESQYKDKALFGPDAIYVAPSGMKMSDTKITRGLEIGKIMNEMNASLMDVTLYVTYLSQRVESTLRVVTGISIGQTTSVTPGSVMQFYGLEASKCKGYCPNTVASARLGQPVYSTEQLGELRETTTAGDKAGDIAVAALTWLTPNQNAKFNNTNRYELHADAAKYEKVVTGVLKEATDKLVSSLTSAQ
ncbi:MAG: hypothetical protein QNK31_02310 [Porticoccus sp.]|nr:hypothetical protein [Porticoccus sp.]